MENVYPLNTTSASITWSVNKEEIASINSEGVLTGLSCGVVKVTVKDNITEISSIVYVDVVENESKLDKVVEVLTIESIKEFNGFDAGIKLNLFNRAVFAAREGSIQLLVSSNIDSESRIIINRNF